MDWRPLLVVGAVLVLLLLVDATTLSEQEKEAHKQRDDSLPTPPRPVTPSQFTSVVVIGLNSNSPFLNGTPPPHKAYSFY